MKYRTILFNKCLDKIQAQTKTKSKKIKMKLYFFLGKCLFLHPRFPTIYYLHMYNTKRGYFKFNKQQNPIYSH